MKSETRRWRLRERTAAAHATVDAEIGQFDTRESYGRYLTSIFQFRAPIEAALADADWPPALGEWRPRMISTAIGQDLDDLAIPRPPTSSARIATDSDRLLGLLYVLEGSALGARVLFERAKELGLTEAFGARHLDAQGSDIEGWRTFILILERATPFDLETATSASLATFALAEAAFERC